MLPPAQTRVLWAAEIAVLAAVLVLRSGWGRDLRWAEAQSEIGTLANDYYEPRREMLTNGFAVAGGVLGGLWWATATWGVLLTGVRRNVAGRGLADFETAAVAGAITGSIIGAAIGLAVGHVWETRHRRRRVAQRATHA